MLHHPAVLFAIKKSIK